MVRSFETDNIEAMIRSGAAPLDIRKHFRSFEEAVRFYSAVRTREYGMGNYTPICCACGKPTREFLAEIEWAAQFSKDSPGRIVLMFLALLAHLHLHSRIYYVGFRSFHAFCRPCWSQFRWMQFLRDLLTALKNLAILAGVILGAAYGTASLVQDHLQQNDKLELWLASAGGFAFAFMGGFFGIAIRLLGIPHSIRSVAPRPFRPMRTFLMYSIVVPGNPPQIRHAPRYRPVNPRAMSWQQTVAVLLVLFAALPGLFMAYAGGMTPPIRSAGRTMLATGCIAVALLTIWHFRRQRKKRSNYYAGLSQHFARQQTSSISE